jgi:hypothetical protein
MGFFICVHALSALKGNIMDAKKFLGIALITLLALSGATLALAGPTSISGPMSCTMPTLLEMNAQSTTPVLENMGLQQTTLRGQATVVTVCAK